MKHQKPRFILFLVCVCLFLLGAGVRLCHIGGDTPQPDELHWRSRSHDALNNLRNGEWSTYNVHLGHPGIPASLLYASTELFIDKYNKVRDFERGEEGYVDHLTALRVSNAVFSSLLFPLVFIFGLVLFGMERKGYAIGVLASLLLIFSPHHLDASRMAHLDSILTFFITLTCLFFVLAEKSATKSWTARWTLLGGVSWGLSIATKPIAGFIIPAFLIYRIAKRLMPSVQSDTKTKAPIIRISDLWAVFIGHVVLGALYTRLWQHDSKYVSYYHINPMLTRVVYHLGEMIQHAPLFLFFLVIILAINILLIFRKKPDSGAEFIYRSLLALVLLSAILLGIFPDVVTNIIRFWLWTAGLSDMTHRAYGITWQPLKYGYLQILFTKLPILILLSALASLCLFLFRVVNKIKVAQTFDRKTQEIILLFLVLVITWITLLSVSPKQTIRYVLPVLPGIYFLAAISIYQAVEVLCVRNKITKIIQGGLYAGVVLFVAINSLLWFPNFGLFGNVFSGGLEGEIASGRPLRVVGTEEGLRFLQDTAIEQKRDLIIALMGDQDLMNHTYRRRYAKEERRLSFMSYEKEHSGDYVLVFPGFLHFLSKMQLDGFIEVFSYNFRNTSMLKIFESPYRDFLVHLELDLQKTPRGTGGGGYFANELGRVVNSENDKKGFISFGATMRIKKGQFEIVSPAVVTDARQFQGGKGVYKIELGPCQKIITVEELKKDQLTPQIISCDFEKDTRAQFRIYWFGEVSLYLGNPTFRARH